MLILISQKKLPRHPTFKFTQRISKIGTAIPVWPASRLPEALYKYGLDLIEADTDLEFGTSLELVDKLF